jgi:pimeloyl-ACP methyl ester carboxylesterase
MSTVACSFRNRDGLEIRGLFFDPPADRSPAPLGIVYLPGFVLGYSAVHRLGLEVLDRFSRAGYPGYVFDQAGVGESDGESLAGPHEDLARHVADGGLVADTLEALQHFAGARAVTRLLLIGHCGGALTASYAGMRDKRVAGLVLLSPPVLKVGEPDAPVPVEAVNQRIRFYRTRLTSGRSWSNLILGRTDYRMLARTVWSKVRFAVGGAPTLAFNERLVEAVLAVARRGRVLIIAGDHDDQIRELNEFTRSVTNAGLAYTILPDTSHGFVTDESMDLLTAEMDAFAARVASLRGLW